MSRTWGWDYSKGESKVEIPAETKLKEAFDEFVKKNKDSFVSVPMSDDEDDNRFVCGCENCME